MYSMFDLRADVGLGSSIRLNDTWHVLGRVKRVFIKLQRAESLALVRHRLLSATFNNDASRGERSTLVGGDGVPGVNKVHVLDASIGAASSVVPVAGNASKIVVVQMGMEEVIRGWVPLVSVVEPVVMDSGFCNHIVGPACPCKHN